MAVIPVAPVSDNTEQYGTYFEDDGMDPKTQERGESQPQHNGNELYRTLRPMLLTMKVFGQYSLDKIDFNNTLSGKIFFGYSILTLAVLWGNVCLNLPLILELKGLDDIITRGGFLTWYVYVSCQGTAMFLMSVRKKAWRQFFALYDLAQNSIWKVDGHQILRKRVKVYVMVSWFSMIVNMGFLVYISFWTNVIISPLNASNEFSVLAVISVFMSTYCTAAWILPIVLSVLMNDLLATNFKLFNKRLDERGRNCPCNCRGVLGRIRDLHQKLTCITDTADTLFAGITSFCIIFNLITICSCLYSMIYNSYNTSDPLVLISQSFWIACSSLILFLNTGTCAWVKEEVGLVLYTQL